MANEYKSFTFELLELGDEHALGCKCCRFYRGSDLPIPRQLTADEFAAGAKELSTCIWKDWTRLNAVIKRFESTIQKRWLKKGLKTRRELLRKAWPTMSATHRPDFENFRNTSKQASRARTCRAASYLWPYINLEDLQQRHLLLLFLNSRGRNLPATFRIADVKAAHLGDGWFPDLDRTQVILNDSCCNEMYLEIHKCDNHFMLFQDQHSLQAYGELVNRSVTRLKPHQFKYMSRSSQGLLALEIQRGIYSFLLSCVKLILHDVRSADMFYLAPHQPEPPMRVLADAGKWSSLAGHALEASYRIPQKLDLERLKLLVEARRSCAEDHVWGLKEDPSYFIDNLREWNEHDGNPDTKPCWCQACCHREAGRMARHAYTSFVFWDDIYRKLASMDPIEVQLKRAKENQVQLAAKDENKWTALFEILEAMKGASISLLSDGLRTSPRLRNKYEVWAPAGFKERWVLKPKSGEAAQRIERLFDAIFSSDQRKLHGLQGLVQEAQYMLDTDPEAAQCMDAWITGHFSDLALISELITSIDGLAPWFDQNTAYALIGTNPVEKQIHETRDMVNKLHEGIEFACTHLGRDTIEQASWDYPVDKRPSKANIAQLRSAERRLDIFWLSLEIDVYELKRIRLSQVLEMRMLYPRELYRTPEWREPVQLRSTEITHKQPLAALSPNIGQCESSNSATPPPKEKLIVTPAKGKVKTRGQAAAPDPQTHAYQAGIAVTPAAPSLRAKTSIPKKAYRIFCALLPSRADVIQQRGEIAWEELLAAMEAIGFEPEKLYGSVWIFKPLPKGDHRRKIDLPRSIQFHEPKEVRRGQKIPRPMVRMLGRRLRHAFGWEDGEAMFQCER